MNIREVPLTAVLEASPGVTVVDTPGFNSSWGELEQLAGLLQGLGEVDLFVLAWRHGDRLELQTKVREDFTITEKAPRAFS